jgi:hypothetical protein
MLIPSLERLRSARRDLSTVGGAEAVSWCAKRALNL